MIHMIRPWRRQGRPRQHPRGGGTRQLRLDTGRRSDYASAEHGDGPRADHEHDGAHDHHHDTDDDFNERGA